MQKRKKNLISVCFLLFQNKSLRNSEMLLANNLLHIFWCANQLFFLSACVCVCVDQSVMPFQCLSRRYISKFDEKIIACGLFAVQSDVLLIFCVRTIFCPHYSIFATFFSCFIFCYIFAKLLFPRLKENKPVYVFLNRIYLLCFLSRRKILFTIWKK